MVIEDRTAGESRDERSENAAGLAPARPLEVLFVMRNLGAYLRFFRSALELLLDRGHAVRLLLENDDHGTSQQEWLDTMQERPNFSCDIVDHFSASRWTSVGRSIRRTLDYVRYLNPEFNDWPLYRARSGRRSPPFIKVLTAPSLMRTDAALAALRWILSVLDRAVPRAGEPARYMDRVKPDVLVLCDYGMPGSLHSTYVEVAGARAIPTALCVASWDNLTSRQLIRVEPDALLLWNTQQAQEAKEIHGIPVERIFVTGAQCFDHWFTWQPRPRTMFASRVRLDPTRPFVLWVGAALVRANRTEAEYVTDWLTALRSSGDPKLRDLGVLLRPHPKRIEEWLGGDFSSFENVAVWPREGMTMPTDNVERADYYDSIHHSAAVVGINTSAMIEAAIIGRPVLGILPSEFALSHEGTLHFAYVAESAGGIVRAARSIDEHLEQIRLLLGGYDDGFTQRNVEFVARFVRPHGLERPATPIFVKTLERVAHASVRRKTDPLWVAPVRASLATAIVVGQSCHAEQGLVRRLGRTLKRSTTHAISGETRER